MSMTRRGILGGALAAVALGVTGCTVVCEQGGTCYVVQPIWENQLANLGETPASMFQRLSGRLHGGTVGWLQDGVMLTTVGDDETERPDEWVFRGGESITFFEIIILDSAVAEGDETYASLFRKLTNGQDSPHTFGTVLRNGQVIPMTDDTWHDVAQRGDIVVIYDDREEIAA